MTDAYGSVFQLLVHSDAISLLVVKTRGLNEDFSMSVTLWLYKSFFSFACFWQICERDLSE